MDMPLEAVTFFMLFESVLLMQVSAQVILQELLGKRKLVRFGSFANSMMLKRQSAWDLSIKWFLLISLKTLV